MVVRLLIAALGAVAITTILFLGMDAVTDVFRERSNERGYRISDVIRRDRSGRPDMPETPARLPALPESEQTEVSRPRIGSETPVAPEPPISRPSLSIDPGVGQPD